jgi:hypothetical protein
MLSKSVETPSTSTRQRIEEKKRIFRESAGTPLREKAISSSSGQALRSSQSLKYPNQNHLVGDTGIYNRKVHEMSRSSDAASLSTDVRANEAARIQPISSKEMHEALLMLRYDIHKEVQVIIKEQVRQFAIAKSDTNKMINDLAAQLHEALASNAELRAENERLRHIY